MASEPVTDVHPMRQHDQRPLPGHVVGEPSALDVHELGHQSSCAWLIRDVELISIALKLIILASPVKAGAATWRLLSMASRLRKRGHASRPGHMATRSAG